MTVNARAGPSLRRPPEAAACAGMADADRCAWRLIIDAEPRSGPANMALDEAIACAVARSDAPPTLRLYAWRPWAVSIGRFQSARDVDAAAVRERGGELVRRLSGGRALLHAEEVTYAVLLPQGDPHARDGVLATYRRLSAGLVHNIGQLLSNILLDTGYARTLTQQELVLRRKMLDGKVAAICSYSLETHYCRYRFRRSMTGKAAVSVSLSMIVVLGRSVPDLLEL